MRLNWNFLGGRGAKQKSPAGGVWNDIFWNCTIAVDMQKLTLLVLIPQNRHSVPCVNSLLFSTDWTRLRFPKFSSKNVLLNQHQSFSPQCQMSNSPFMLPYMFPVHYKGGGCSNLNKIQLGDHILYSLNVFD